MIAKLTRDVVYRKHTKLSRRYAQQFHPALRCSQAGEDGIIREIVRRLQISHSWFVELGAGDGVQFSNTYALRKDGWRGVGIESDPDRFIALQQTTASEKDYVAVCRRVSAEGEDRLDAVLTQTPLPRDFDLLSLDIDSYDYWIWRSLQDYRPTIVIVEYNAFFAPTEAKTLPLHRATEWPYFGASAAALDSLGRSKDYRLVGYTSGLNLFFVREQFARSLFERLPVSCVPTEPHDVRQQWTQWDRFVGV